MHCPSCSSAYLDPYGRCPACGYTAAPPGGMQAAGLYPVAYTAPAAPTGIAIAAQLLFGVQILAGLVAVVGGVLELSSLAANGTIGAAAAAVGVLSALIGFPSFIAVVVVFIIWFHKSRVLSDILGPNHPKTFSRGFAIGGWFIPVGFFWIPRGVAGDIWAASRPLEPTPNQFPRRSGLLNAWWTGWCLFWAVGVIGGIVGVAGDRLSLSHLQTAAGFGIATDFMRALAALLALLVVRKITTMQRVRILQGPGADHPYALQAASMPYPQTAYAPQPYQPQPVQDASAAPAAQVPPQDVQSPPLDGGLSPLTGPVTPRPAPAQDPVPEPAVLPPAVELAKERADEDPAG
ncbi:hypothetical protein ABIA33_004540 [Streptacidiphilus sp. MAP12-16]|uniref:DUF4328 domain-containing protein n=1 Tax=Streptacidiphilus sp. MAP12-16 TaxID=3156300 RepID=UPI003514FDEE